MSPERDIDIYPRRISFSAIFPNYLISNRLPPRRNVLEDASFQDRADWGMMTATYTHMLEKKLSGFLCQEAEALKQRIFKGSTRWKCDTSTFPETFKTNPGEIILRFSTVQHLLIVSKAKLINTKVCPVLTMRFAYLWCNRARMRWHPFE